MRSKFYSSASKQLALTFIYTSLDNLSSFALLKTVKHDIDKYASKSVSYVLNLLKIGP